MNKQIEIKLKDLDWLVINEGYVSNGNWMLKTDYATLKGATAGNLIATEFDNRIKNNVKSNIKKLPGREGYSVSDDAPKMTQLIPTNYKEFSILTDTKLIFSTYTKEGLHIFYNENNGKFVYVNQEYYEMITKARPNTQFLSNGSPLSAIVLCESMEQYGLLMPVDVCRGGSFLNRITVD